MNCTKCDTPIPKRFVLVDVEPKKEVFCNWGCADIYYRTHVLRDRPIIIELKEVSWPRPER